MATGTTEGGHLTGRAASSRTRRHGGAASAEVGANAAARARRHLGEQPRGPPAAPHTTSRTTSPGWR